MVHYAERALADMRMADPVPTFTYLVNQLAEDHPDLAYLHVVQVGISGGTDMVPAVGEVPFPCVSYPILIAPIDCPLVVERLHPQHLVASASRQCWRVHEREGYASG